MIFGSCSIIDTIVNDDKSGKITNTKQYKKSVSCNTTNSTFSIAGHSAHTNTQFYKFLSTLEEKKIHTSFVEKAAMWSLIQMVVRPDMASPTSRFTYGLRKGSTFNYRDYQSESEISDDIENYPFLYGINKMLLDSSSKRSLKGLAKILDHHFPKGIIVVPELQEFISENKKELKSYDQLRPFYFRGKQGLRSNETIKRPHFIKIVKLLKRKKDLDTNYHTDLTLFPLKIKKYHAKVSCNYDLNLYKHNVFLKTPTVVSSVPFMLSQGENLFIASASQDVSNLFPLSVAPLIGGNSNKGLRSAICHMNMESDVIDMISTQNRDPAQILYDLLLRSNITFSKEALQESMEMGRTLLFLNPYRAIVESNLVSDEQVEKLSKRRTPIYHHYPIGNVFMGLFKNENNNTTPILDLRGENQLLCK